MRAGSQRIFGIVLLTILFAATTYADTFTFSTIPANGNLSAAAGSTVGWGYTVTNNSLTQWLEFTSLGAGVFQHGTIINGIFDFPIVAPNSTVTQVFDGINGLMGFQWAANAPAGFSNSGDFVLNADWLNGDPLAPVNPGTVVGSVTGFKVPYSVTVSASTAVPESSSLQLLACGLGGLLLFNVYRKKLLPGS